MQSRVKLILVLLALLVGNSSSKITIPAEYEAHQSIITIGIDMTLSENGEKFGDVKQRILVIGHQFQLMDNTGKTVAVASQKLITIGADYEIKDSQDNIIGSIISPIAKNWLPIFNYFDVYDENRKLISKVRFYELLSINVEVFDPEDEKIIQITRPFSFFQNRWIIEYEKPESQKFKIIHSFLPSTITAFYKSKKEKQRHHDKHKQQS